MQWWIFGSGTIAALKTCQVRLLLLLPACPPALLTASPACLPAWGCCIPASVRHPHACNEQAPLPGCCSPSPHACTRAPPPVHIRTLQACNSYPESGVCDAATWKFLLGPSAQPSDISKLHSGGSSDEDLADQVRCGGAGGLGARGRAAGAQGGRSGHPHVLFV